MSKAKNAPARYPDAPLHSLSLEELLRAARIIQLRCEYEVSLAGDDEKAVDTMMTRSDRELASVVRMMMRFEPTTADECLAALALYRRLIKDGAADDAKEQSVLHLLASGLRSLARQSGFPNDKKAAA